MNDEKLDMLLSQPEALDGRDFTNQVMDQLPGTTSHKLRDRVLVASLIIGGGLTAISIPGSEQLLNFFASETTKDPILFSITASIIVCLIGFSIALTSAANDEV